MDSFQEKYNALVIKYNALLAENEELKSILSQHGIVYSTIKCADESTAFSSIIYPPIKLSIDEKIALFRNFFKGRDDVFVQTWFPYLRNSFPQVHVLTDIWPHHPKCLVRYPLFSYLRYQ